MIEQKTNYTVTSLQKWKEKNIGLLDPICVAWIRILPNCKCKLYCPNLKFCCVLKFRQEPWMSHGRAMVGARDEPFLTLPLPYAKNMCEQTEP